MPKKQANKYLTPLALSSLLASSASMQAAIIYHTFTGEDAITIAPPAGDQLIGQKFTIFDDTDANKDDIMLGAGQDNSYNTHSAQIVQPSDTHVGNYALNFFVNNPTQNFAKKFAHGTNITGAHTNRVGFFFKAPTNGNEDDGDYTAWLNRDADTVSGYAGFKFREDNMDKYGWIKLQIAVTRDADKDITRVNSLTLLEFAYEDTGAAIYAGQIPIPEASTTATALGLLALGAVGVARRCKKA